MANNQITIKDSQILTNINGWGNERILPLYQGSNFEAWKQDAALAVIENDDLRACITTEVGKISMIRALQRSATSGLSLNPQKGESALVAINGKVNFWFMKNGLSKMALRTGALQYLQSDTVYDGDTFVLKKTAKGDDYEFTPDLDNRGNAKGFFAVAVLKDGRTIVEYWSLSQAEEHKKKWGKGLNNPTSAWNKNPNAMHEKGVLKALITGLQLPELVSVIEIDNNYESIRDVTDSLPKGASSDELASAIKKQKDDDLNNSTNEEQGAAQDGELDIF